MSTVMALRAKVQEAFVKKHGIKLGFMSFFIKAVVDALKHVPAINGQMEGDDIFIQNHFYDIGVAVGTDKGLVVPVLRDCDTRSFAGIEQDIAAYAKKAREGKLQISDLTGGVFTVSNGGTYGSLMGTPILNPPQSGILGMHNIVQRPVAVEGEVEIRPDDVPRAELRSPRGRRQGGGHLPRAGEGMHRGSDAAAFRTLIDRREFHQR